MSSKRNRRNFSINSSIETQDVFDIGVKTGNVYQSLTIIAKRANQISGELKEELLSKLNEFASTTDNLEEVHENKEQIEISRYYERMPHPTLLALEEFMEDKTYYRKVTKKDYNRNNKSSNNKYSNNRYQNNNQRKS